MVGEMGGKWSYSCSQDLFKITCSFFMYLPSYFSTRYVSVHVLHPYSSTDTATAWKKFHSILLEIRRRLRISSSTSRKYTCPSHIPVRSKQPEALVSQWTQIRVHVFSTKRSYLLKLVDELIYVGSNISSTDSDVTTLIGKMWTASGRLSIIWKSINNVCKLNSFTCK